MTAQTITILLLIGLMAGTLSGIAGIGGGVIIVPALIYILGFSAHQAQGTSLGLLLLPVGFLAVLNYYKQGYIDMKIVLVLAVAFIIGGWIGSKFAIHAPAIVLKRIFAIVMLIIGFKMLFFDK